PAEGVDLHTLPYFGTARAFVAGVPVLLSRTGYTGEDGFELFVSTDEVARTWQALVRAGAKPCGLAARDVCRLEAGLRLYGSDMDEQTNPYQCGLGWTVKLAKGPFEGREALQRARREEPDRRLVGLSCGGRTIPRHGAEVRQGSGPIGHVTSGTYSFWLRKGIALASIDASVARAGLRAAIEVRGGESEAEVVALPFYRGSVRQATRA